MTDSSENQRLNEKEDKSQTGKINSVCTCLSVQGHAAFRLDLAICLVVGLSSCRKPVYHFLRSEWDSFAIYTVFALRELVWNGRI